MIYILAFVIASFSCILLELTTTNMISQKCIVYAGGHF